MDNMTFFTTLLSGKDTRMAAKTDSDESFEEIKEENGVLMSEIIKDALEEATDEYRCFQEDRLKSRDPDLVTKSYDINEINNNTDQCCPKMNDNCQNYPEDGEDIHVLRKSQSDDVLSSGSTPRQDNPPLASEQTQDGAVGTVRLPEMLKEYSQPLKEYDDEEEQFHDCQEDGVDDDDDDELDTGNVDFFHEYDRKIDVLECCDYALEESFIRLREHIQSLCDTEQNKTTTTTTTAATATTTEKVEAGDEQQTCSDGAEMVQNTGTGSDETDSTSYTNERLESLKHTMLEMQGRFERFISEVGETIQLGALAAKHSQRVERWAGEIQSTYAILKNDHQKLQCYIDVKERDWIRSRDAMKDEINYNGELLHDLIDEVKKNEDLKKKTEKLLYKKIGDRMVKRPVNPEKSCIEESLIDYLTQQRFEEGHALALDFSRRMKISELKLVILQQQSYIQKIELQNKELDGILRGLLYNPENEQEDDQNKAYELRYSEPVPERVSQVSEVLNCDQGVYLPGRSTDPDTAAAQVFNIADGSIMTDDGHSSPFDPTKLHYIKTFTADQVRDEDVTEDGNQPEAGQITKPETTERGDLPSDKDKTTDVPHCTGESGEPNGFQVKSLMAQSRNVLEQTRPAIPAN